MKIRDRETIPAFLSIDVEPDAFQISGDDTEHWSGYRATHEFAVSLRRQLAQASGAKPIFGWYYRMDPQIEQVCGRADIAVTAFPDRAAALREEGDYFGVHTHPTLVQRPATLGTRLERSAVAARLHKIFVGRVYRVQRIADKTLSIGCRVLVQ
jgi:hypothetical protein